MTRPCPPAGSASRLPAGSRRMSRNGAGWRPRSSPCSGLASRSSGGQDRLFSAWRSDFERIAAADPVVMVFEDLQWADSGKFLAFIDHLVDWSRGVAIYVVALARPSAPRDTAPLGRGQAQLPTEPRPGAASSLGDAGAPRGPRARALAGRCCADRGARRRDPPVRGRDRADARGTGLALEAGDRAYRPVGDLADVVDPGDAPLADRCPGSTPSIRPIARSSRPRRSIGHAFGVDGPRRRSPRSDAGGVERRLLSLVRRELVRRNVDPRAAERGQFALV